MASQTPGKKEPSPLTRKVIRAWKRGKGWVQMPSRARNPLTETQVRRAFYERAFEIQDLLSIIRRLAHEGDAKAVKRLEAEAILMAKELARKMDSHAVTRALRTHRVFDPSIKQRIRYAMYLINTNPGHAEIIEQNRRIEKMLGKKYEPFTRDYKHMMGVMHAQVSTLAVRKQGSTRTVFAVQPSPFVSVRRLFRRRHGKRTG